MSYALYLPMPAIVCAIAFDALASDPEWLPHPVRLIGRAITRGENLLRTGMPRRDLRNGALLTGTVVTGAAVTAWALVAAASLAGNLAGLITAIIVAWTTIAFRGLDRAAYAVERALAANDLSLARQDIRALVGRDPDALDRNALIRATVESVAENCSDAVIAPIFYLFVGGPVAAIAYKAVNTLDSMTGYLDDRYRYFGRAAARLDDLVNLLPARLTALCLIGAAGLLSRRATQAYVACVEDASTHKSPNAGYPESAMAGALGIQLGGDAVYGGEVEHRAPMGHAEHESAIADIASARTLMLVAAAIAVGILALTRYLLVRAAG
ncbi:MAG TPA: adenosylcobinamide-phosphate synthase CbiB [Candidatus Binataceae bacterium]|nr:adenosylcobinamide-phosphate synthase CbiB [Candidatus Binataceae bacterium]